MSALSLKRIGKATAAALKAIMAPQVGRDDVCEAIGYVENSGAPTAVVPDFIGQRLFDTTNERFYIAFGVAAGEWSPIAAAVAPFGAGVMPAPQVATGDATLTAAQMLGGIIVATPAAAAAYTTLTGALLEDAIVALKGNLVVGDWFDLTIINIGGTADDITFTAGATGITIVGEALIRPVADSATDGATGQGTFRFRRTAADTFVAYRVA